MFALIRNGGQTGHRVVTMPTTSRALPRPDGRPGESQDSRTIPGTKRIMRSVLPMLWITRTPTVDTPAAYQGLDSLTQRCRDSVHRTRGGRAEDWSGPNSHL